MRILASKAKYAVAATVAALLGAEPAAAQPKILIDGSTGTAPLVEALGKAFTAKSSVAVEIGKGMGIEERLQALSERKIDLAMASHGSNPLWQTELTRKGMTVLRIAMTPVVFAAHASAQVDNLTDAQICAIYAGSAINWKDLGGTDLAIVPLDRPRSEVDAEIVRSGIACFKNLRLSSGVRLMTRAGEMAKALAEMSGAIGVTNATFINQSEGKIRPIALNGVAANEPNVVAGRYRLTRDAFLIADRTVSTHVKAFLDFVRGPEGAAVIRASGAIAATK